MAMQEPWEFLPEATRLHGARSAGSAHALIAPLHDLGIIRIAGTDAESFLQAQLTQSVADLDEHHSRLAGWCSPKGRLLALFRVLRTDGDFRLILPREIIPDVLRRLRLFVLRAHVALEDESAVTGIVGVAGAEAHTLLADHAGTIPAAMDEVGSAGDLQLLRLPDPEPRYLLLAPEDQLQALWTSLARHALPVASEVWRLLDIRAGLPQVTADARERHIPQMLNLEPLQGLSYRKGCYPGQEIVARTHYLGRLKRRMYRGSLAGAGVPPVGAPVRDSSDRAQGEVLLAAATEGDSVELLAVIRADAEARELTVDGRPLTLLTLPYPPPDTGGADEPED
jgi:folate-binding protein YgfZ